MFGLNKNNQILNSKVDTLEGINRDLLTKTAELASENRKINSILGLLGYDFELFTGENNYNELGAPKEIIIMYEQLRIRSWEFILKNHIANLIVTKRINWMIGSGLLFNAKPHLKPFEDYYEDKGKEKQKEFVKNVEYLYRNYINTVQVDHTKEKNLHELARVIDYNASGDGDVLLLARVENGFPTVQVISGQCVTEPASLNGIPQGNRVYEGVEKDKDGKIVAYHVLTNTIDGINNIITERIPAYFKNNKNIRQAWLYKASDLQKLGETRAVPLLSHIFETLKHVNDYLIANSKNAQLLAQLVFFLEKDQNSTGERIFGGNSINVAGMSDTAPDQGDTDADLALYANKIERKLQGSGIVGDLPKGVKAKLLNPTAQSDQKEYLDSTLRTIFAQSGTPYEVMISSYDSNYTASMGARSDYQHILDVLTEVIPSNMLYKMNYKLFLYVNALNGNIDCPMLIEAYRANDYMTIEAISKSTFEGTKLKPIDPLKFIKSLKEQLPEKIREHVPFNTTEKLINAASGGDFEGVVDQMVTEIEKIESEGLLPDDIREENTLL